MLISLSQLQKIMPYSGSKASLYIHALNASMIEFNIDSKARIASFLAQIGHESGSLRYVCEIASGAAYNLRPDLGNTVAGDGETYKGHGLIQITGKYNHFVVADFFKIPREKIAAWLQTPEGACRSAGWFWHANNLNALADVGDNIGISSEINCGHKNVPPTRINGLAERLAFFTRAKEVLG